MANYQSDMAIVLRVTDFSETSQIVALLTRSHGIVPMIAKGSKRPAKKGVVSGPLDLLTAGEVVFVPAKQSAELATLAEWNLTDHRTPLRANLPALHAALVAAEITLTILHPHDPHPELFTECNATFELLATPQRARALVAYAKAALVSAGYGPQLDACVSCGKQLAIAAPDSPVRYSPLAGGILCADCPHQGPLISATAKIILALARLTPPADILAHPPERIGDPAALRKAMDLLLAQIQTVTERPLKTAYILPTIFV